MPQEFKTVLGRKAFRVFCLMLMSSVMLGAQATLAQELFAFSESESSEIDYRDTPFKPDMRCKDLLRHSTREFSVLSAQELSSESGKKFCRVAGLILPKIEFELNLPTAWNGRSYMYGNGGYTGRPASHPRRRGSANLGIENGFATVYSNGGYDTRFEQGLSWAINNPSNKANWAYRATHLTALAGQELIEIYYDRDPDYDYFDGCSWGGRQGFVMAQRFPELFDGILAGSPVFDFVGLQTGLRKVVGLLHDAQPEEAQVIKMGEAVLQKCDALDGSKDGVVTNPRQCEFDPVEDLPKCDASDNDCFDERQRALLSQIYSPTTVQGEEVYPGWPVSGEVLGYKPKLPGQSGGNKHQTGWYGAFTYRDVTINGKTERRPPEMLGRMSDSMKAFLFEHDDENRDWQEVDLDRDYPRFMEQGARFNATDADLNPLREAGGKLLVYHGWADANINPNRTYEYFKEVHQAMGKKRAQDTARLFMVPGVFHCRGGSSAWQFDGMSRLINWVEGGDAPDKINFHGNEIIQPGQVRPVCAFPKYAHMKRKGEIGEADSYQCKFSE